MLKWMDVPLEMLAILLTSDLIAQNVSNGFTAKKVEFRPSNEVRFDNGGASLAL